MSSKAKKHSMLKTIVKSSGKKAGPKFSLKGSLKSLKKLGASPLKLDNSLGLINSNSADSIMGGGGSNMGTSKVF